MHRVNFDMFSVIFAETKVESKGKVFAFIEPECHQKTSATVKRKYRRDYIQI